MRIVVHGHHASTLFSVYWDEAAVAERVRQIQREKPIEERALRLALLQDVTSLLPHNEAWAALDEALAAYDKAGATLKDAWAAYNKALAAYDKAEAALGETWAAYDKAEPAYDKAEAALDETQAAYLTSFDAEAFHRAHCHPRCPWDGETIFARGVDVSVLTDGEEREDA